MSLSEEKIDEVMASFIGEITQITAHVLSGKSKTVNGYMNMHGIMNQWIGLLERLKFTVLSDQVN